MQSRVRATTERIFREVCLDIEGYLRALNIDAAGGFRVRFIPCWTASRQAHYDILDPFRLVLEGCAHANNGVASPVWVLEVIEPDPDGGEVFTHTFLVTVLLKAPPVDEPAGVIPTSWSFAFVGIATSGYGGTGPEIYRRIQEAIDEKEGKIHHRAIRVDQDPLEAVFKEVGPLVEISYPHELFPEE